MQKYRNLKRSRVARAWRLAPLALLALVAACVPSANVLSVPTFSVDTERTGFVRIDPPGVGDGSALFRLALEVENPNAIQIKLSGLDGSLFIGNARAATATFRGGVDVPARGRSTLLVDVLVPLGAAPALLESIGSFVGGTPTPYRLEAAITIDVLGTPQRFPEFTLARGELQRPAGLRTPGFELAGSELRFESVDSVALTVRGRLTNPGIIGYRVSVPEVRLAVGGAPAATASLSPVDLPAGAAAEVELTFRFNALELGPAVVTQVQSASAGIGGLSVSLAGGWRLEAPGVATLGLEPSTLVDGVLR